MPAIRKIAPAVLLTTIGLILAACGTTTKVTTLEFDKDYRGARFSNVLVIGVALDYDKRAQFERSVVSELKQRGAHGTAYYTVVGHNPPVTTSAIIDAVRARNFDAVLFTHVKDSETQIKAQDGPVDAQTRVIGGRFVNIFRYDYYEYAAPETISVNVDLTLITQLYDASTQEMVWAIESSAKNSQTGQAGGMIIDAEAKEIVNALNREKLVGGQ